MCVYIYVYSCIQYYCYVGKHNMLIRIYVVYISNFILYQGNVIL